MTESTNRPVNAPPFPCEEAWKRILARAKPLGAATMSLGHAVGLILAKAVKAPIDVPPFDNSAMDGFAVRARDVAGATPQAPRRLKLVGSVAAGKHWPGAVKRGQAVEIMTGAPVPKGADAVVRVEDSRRLDARTVEILTEKPRGEARRARGSDLRRGRVALPSGTRLGPVELSIIASLGLARVTVRRRPRVALLASGSELMPPGRRLRPGEIYESSHWALGESLRAVGVEVEWLGVARDDRRETRRMIRRGLRADVLVTAGGVSMGAFDFVRDELRAAGGREIFWKVAQRPGKPLLFAMRGRTLVFGLPGNPVSSLVCLELYVKPALRKMMGLRDLFPPLLRFPAAERITKPAGLRTFHRVSFVKRGGRVAVITTGNQSSGVFSSMLNAHALTNLPPGPTVIEVGEEIECWVLDARALARTLRLDSVWE
jgi:molybdopterin molybdotransferase